jgi:5-(carboxyamino)imidazole ribonucleotide synthase
MAITAAPLVPGAWLGLLGGGQLGRMFAHAAQRLGYRVLVLAPDSDNPAGRVADEFLCADYTDPAALAELARRVGAVTTEFENVPAPALEFLAQRVPVRPGAAALAIAQDRLKEKRFFTGCGIRVAPHAAIASEADIDAFDAGLLPGILKTMRLGYDGKGQIRVATRAHVGAAFRQLNGVPCVLEQQLALACELSVLVARTTDGSMVSYPPTENEHRGGILAVSLLPARIDEGIATAARGAAIAVAEGMSYTGVLCVEFFLLRDGALVANEMAPRPHNSGHATIEACSTSQFEQQARVLASLPLGDATLLAPAVTLNVLGDLWFREASTEASIAAPTAEPRWCDVLAVPGAKLHLYGKNEARRGRKMGHVTCLGATLEQALERARRVCAALGIEPPQRPPTRSIADSGQRRAARKAGFA